MKRYHILFKEKDSYTATGINVEANTEMEALYAFRNEYPNVIFLYIASEDMFELKKTMDRI